MSPLRRGPPASLVLPAALPACPVALLVALLLLATACGERPSSTPHGSEPAALDFSAEQITLDRLESPVVVPVVVGSRPSRESMESSDPAVVSVEPDGRIVAHRDGEATLRVRGRPEARLAVTVTTTRSIAVVPDQLALRPGNEARLRLIDAESGREISAEAGEWATDAPRALLVRPGFVKAWSTGQARIRVRYAGSEAVVLVAVEEDPLGLVVSPSRLSLRPGEVAMLRARFASGDAPATWTTSAASVLASPGEGLFEARRAGWAKACARSRGEEACADVEVRP